jgi:hypothetical protein
MFIINLSGKLKATVSAFILLFFSCNTDASAQRTMDRQLFVSAEGHVSALNLTNAGGGLSMGQYLLNGQWYCSISSSFNTIGISSGSKLGYIDIYALGGYMYRIISNRSRSLNFYGGGGAFIGYELYDPMKRVPSHLATNLPEGGTFLYGIDPRIEFEVFIIRKVAVTLGFSSPINFSSTLTKVRPKGTLGIRLNL